MNHYLLTLLLLTLFTSCMENEKSIVLLSTKSKNYKTKLLEELETENLSIRSLDQLGQYSEIIVELNDSIQTEVGDKGFRRRFLNYISKLNSPEKFCSSHLISTDIKKRIESSCLEGYFDICPVSFLKYAKSKDELLKTINNIIGDEMFNKTDCPTFMEIIK